MIAVVLLEAMPGLSLGGVLYFGLTTILLPVVGWLLTNGIRGIKAHTVLDLKVRDACNAIADLKTHHQANDSRLARVEDAIVGIRESSQRRDEQFAAITVKLDQLPRLTALLEGLSQSAQAIVPRSEVDSRLQAAEARLVLLERDVRDRTHG